MIHVLAEEVALSGAGFQVTVQDVDDGGFSRSVFPEQPEHFAFLYFKVQVLVNEFFPVIVRYVFTLDYFFPV